jgi:hypothetical protein
MDGMFEKGGGKIERKKKTILSVGEMESRWLRRNW